ncbi:MAG: NUDIX hydrolase [bacterium]
MIKPWKKISEEILAKSPYHEYKVVHFETPDGDPHDYYYPHYPHEGAMVVPVNEEGKLLLVRVYRPIIEQETITFAAGFIEPDETPEESANREMCEETGYMAKKLDYMGKFRASPGSTDERGHIFFATDLYEKTLECEEHEETEAFFVSVERLEEMICKGEFVDGWALSAWAMARGRVLEYVDGLRQER